jgi:hypothetical protein
VRQRLHPRILLLAARAYGIGGVLTTFHTAYEGEVRELIRRSGLDPAHDAADVHRLV